MREFKDKIAVITGAASGIGRGLAEQCAKERMKVVLADIEEIPLKETEKNLKDKGVDTLAVRTDVSKFKDIEALAEKTLDKFGAVHLLFNNAGVSAGSLLWESTLNDWEWTLGVNLKGTIYGIKVFVPIMLKQRAECHIVNTGSVTGVVTPGPFQGIYKMTKHAIVSLSESLFSELKMVGSRIGVSVLCPGFVRTNILDTERYRQAEFKNPPDQRVITKEEEAISGHLQNAIQNGMPPGQCAELVFDAVRHEKLYVLTHPEFNVYIKQRVDNILQGNNPTIEQTA